MDPDQRTTDGLSIVVLSGPTAPTASAGVAGELFNGLGSDGVALDRFSAVRASETAEVLDVPDWGLQIWTVGAAETVEVPAGHQVLWSHRMTLSGDESVIADWQLRAGVIDWGWSHPQGRVSVASGTSLVCTGAQELIDWSARGLAWAQVVSARAFAVEGQLTELEGRILAAGHDDRLAPLWDDLHRLDRSARDAARRLEVITSNLQGPRRVVFCLAVDEWRVGEQLSALRDLVEILRSDLRDVESRRSARLERARTILISVLTATAALSLAVDMLWFAHSEVVDPVDGPARLGGPPVMRLFDLVSPQAILVLVALMVAALVIVLVPRRER